MKSCDHANCEKRRNNYAETHCMLAGCGSPPTHLVKAERRCAWQVRTVAPASASMDSHASRRKGLVTPDVRNAFLVAHILVWRCSLPELNSLMTVIPLYEFQKEPSLMVTAPILISKAQCFTWDGKRPMLANFPALMRFWWFEEATYI